MILRAYVLPSNPLRDSTWLLVKPVSDWPGRYGKQARLGAPEPGSYRLVWYRLTTAKKYDARAAFVHNALDAATVGQRYKN